MCKRISQIVVSNKKIKPATITSINVSRDRIVRWLRLDVGVCKD